MPREWGRFWIAFAIMVLAGAVVFSAILKSPFSVGSIGQWASAMATTLAVWVAVHNTSRTLEKTAEREAEKQSDADRVFLTALYSLSEQAEHMVVNTNGFLAQGTVNGAGITGWVEAVGIEGLLKAIDRMPTHQCPDRQSVHALRNIRTVVSNLGVALQHGVAANSSAGVSVGAITILATQTHVGVKALLTKRSISI